MTTTPELLALRDLCARIEAAGIGYMLTGSLAMAYYARPRMTRDIDLVIELAPDTAPVLAMALEMFETAQRIVLSSLPEGVGERERRRALCRRFYGEDLARRAYG